MYRSLRSTALSFAAVTAAALAAPAAAFAAPAPSSPALSSSAAPAPTTPPAAPATPPAAPAKAAAADDATISATGDLVFLTGNPWAPGADSAITVHNGGTTAAKAYFLLNLPEGAELGATDICRQVAAGNIRDWICGGDELAAGARRDYPIRINAAPDDPQFDKQAYASVTGRTADGTLGQRNDFRINWPSKTTLRLTLKEGTTAGGTTKVAVKVKNTGSFAISAYSVEIADPANVTITGCNYDSGQSDAGCEVYRAKTLKAGATDTFTLTFKVTGADTAIRFALTPANRYTNKDTKATLTLTGTDGDDTGTGTGTGGGAAGGGGLPVTGVDGRTLVTGGAGFIGLGAVLLGIARRRRLA